MASSTKIDDLPMAAPNTTTMSSSSSENIKLEHSSTNYMPPNNVPSMPTEPVSQDTMTNIMSDIKSSTDVTRLPNRDIPTSTIQHTNDELKQPNAIPTSENHIDYINNYDQMLALSQQQQTIETDNNIYDQLQLPIFAGILFFLFQLPFVRKSLFKYLPMLFINENQPKLTGFIVTSVLFTSIIFGFNKYVIE
uniref:Uncharacterized protein n=1 Tax=viral metagenome TaxID=1070528 RepID=A0A6C0KH11_9ZZZZ